mmetsp:Transcript_13921/g.26570  ORF Transcript_13921/g.26570 Transcript_13921/m.26570 type:complete len:136 (+) Transcript_13921:289-696(+)
MLIALFRHRIVDHRFEALRDDLCFPWRVRLRTPAPMDVQGDGREGPRRCDETGGGTRGWPESIARREMIRVRYCALRYEPAKREVVTLRHKLGANNGLELESEVLNATRNKARLIRSLPFRPSTKHPRETPPMMK